MPFGTLSSKGQVTIPLEIRTRLGLKEGDRVEFAVENGQTILRPARVRENAFRAYVGCLPAFGNTQQISEWVAELRDDED